uniref:molybdopterin dinucleotide binding domain-containing protein n=1 Tax=Rhodococcus sp. O3 TaxID=3404919 RepID=UPI003B66FEEA
ARSRVAQVWSHSVGGTVELPANPGRDTAGILAAAAAGDLGALVIGGVDLDDLPDPQAARSAVESAGFVVSLEMRRSSVTDLADVVFPVAAVAEKSGAFLDWEGRVREFGIALRGTDTLPDQRVLDALAAEMGTRLGVPDAESARRELDLLGPWEGQRPADPATETETVEPPRAGPGEAILTGWRMLLDAGRMQDGEPYLAGTARPPVVRLSAATAAEIGASDGDAVTVSTDRGAVTLPLAITEMPDRVVWLPLNSPGSAVHRQLGIGSGGLVRIRVGEVQ